MKPRFEWNAADYAAHSSGQLVWARELIDKLDLQGWESVLDLGCGDGKVTALLAKAVLKGQVLGIDISSAMIDLARDRYPLSKHTNLTFQVLDAVELPFDNHFDVIFSNAVLHWVPDQMPVLMSTKKALRPNGRLLFQMGGQGNAAGVIALMDQMIASDPWKPYFNDFFFPYTFPEPDEYLHWLRQASLTPIRVELIPKQMHHLGKTGLAGWIRTTWLPYLERLPARLQEAFVEEFVHRYVKLCPTDKTGSIEVGMVRLEVEAKN